MSSDVTREVDLPAPPEEVWEQVTRSDRLGEWLEADVEPGQRLAFTWWPLTGDDVGRATSVTITIERTDAGCRLRLVESSRAGARAVAGAVA